MKRTRKELETALAEKTAEADMLHIALADVMARRQAVVGTFTLDGVRITGFLVGATRADGGTLLVGQVVKDCASMWSVYRLEQYHARLRSGIGASEYANRMYELVGKALALRDRIFRNGGREVDGKS